MLDHKFDKVMKLVVTLGVFSLLDIFFLEITFPVRHQTAYKLEGHTPADQTSKITTKLDNLN